MTAARTRPAPLGDTAPTEGKRLMRFDPTINTGTIVQILVVASSALALYNGIRTEQVQTKADVEAVKAAAATDREQTKAALAELKADLKELRGATGEIKESLAILRGRTADTGGRK